ncbi:MAG: hypothetical protein B6I22_08250 [Desulfobacteraceae bacterium 4572_123]|nr:MAG: hypothetical protein B6I22_08250 [Desulfobacteraceae bacterium 4572_123]
MKTDNFRAIISSDWNQCLAPCGPFDPMVYTYPDLTSDLTTIFKEYTNNGISLGTAKQKIKNRLPGPISIRQMDAYLDNAFITYKGVPELIDWCAKNKILFMINTTGFMGYFQRIFVKKLLPKVPVLSANSMIRYPAIETDPPQMYDLKEIQDKGKNTARALKIFGISKTKVVIIGDSGGDGPHFEWGKKQKAYRIGSMAKPSLINYCNRKKIKINFLFGPTFKNGEKKSEEDEMIVDFMELSSAFEKILE